MSRSSLHEERSRQIALKGAYNVRDLGGYLTRDGKITKWGKYVRGDSLHQLPIESQETLRDYGVRHVVDLRYPEEGAYQFQEQLNIHYLNVPLHDPEQLRKERPASLVDLYCQIIDTRQEKIYQIMQHFVNTEDETVLFHCKAGKDRTGIIAALLLDLAGVPHETIVQDYTMTAQFTDLEKKLQNERPSYLKSEKFADFLKCPPENMEQFLTYLYQHYENSEQYLKTIGLHRDELEHIKNYFVTEK